MKQLTLTGILRRSLLHRRARSISALVALTVSAGVATALLTLYADLDNKLHKEFRSFGANIVVTAPNNASLPPDTLTKVQQAAGPEAITTPFAYAVATTDNGTSVVVSGTDMDSAHHLNTWWQVTAWPQPQIRVPQVPTLGPGVIPSTNSPPEAQALIGQRAAQFLGNEKSIHLTFNSKPITLRSVGTLKTGGDEDSRIYIPLEAFEQWTSTTPSVIEVQIPGGAAKVEAALTRLSTLPGIQAQPVRQLVEGESHIVDRTHSLMYAAVLLIALTVAVSVLATLSASVLERRRDFALMKALGGRQFHLTGLFLLEAVALALAGVLAGFAIGSAAALLISEANFHTATLPRISVLPLVLLLNLLIAALAALLPARVLRNLQPASLLRGD